MHDDTSDPRDMRDPNHIWLRQSVTFAVNGQTRTLELALPLRPGATPDEVESLLDEAEAGMRRLSRRLDAHLAEIISAAQPAAPAPAAMPEAAPAPQPTAAPAPAAMPEAAPAPQPTAAPTPRHAPPPQPAAPSVPATPPASIAERPAPRPAAPATPPRMAPPTPSASAPTAPTSGGPDLSRAEFLTAAGALGLDARTVMERLNVRTLSGLNLRESLDLLRRQLVREGGAPADAEPPAEPELGDALDAPAMPAPIGRARFDEEDDGPAFELSYPDPEELPSEDDYAGEDEFAPLEVEPAPPPARPAPARSAPSGAHAGPLGDVPDLDDLLSAASTPAAPVAPAAPTAEAAPAEEPAVVRAREMIAKLRAARPGGQPTEYQRTVYKNVVVDQLGETMADSAAKSKKEKTAYGEKKAAGVVRAVWKLTPDQLGPEQLDELIRWGKEDAFADEVEEMLELLRAEYRAQQAAEQTHAPATPAAPSPPSRRAAQTPQAPEQPATRPTPRGRPAARTTRDSSQGGA